MSDAERWTIRNVPVKYKDALGENADGELVIISGTHPPLGAEIEVVRTSELERVEAERDALTKAMEPLLRFAQRVEGLRTERVDAEMWALAELCVQASEALQQGKLIVREGLAAEEERP